MAVPPKASLRPAPLTGLVSQLTILVRRPSGALRLVASGLATVLLTAFLQADEADARRRSRASAEPSLQILSVTLSPDTYVPGDGSLDFSIRVGLPEGLDGATVLEVSSLITSPSSRHLRFLWSRQPVDVLLQNHAASGGPARSSTEGTPNKPVAAPPRPNQVDITLSWDGTDQNQDLVTGGRYDYVIRAKLLALEDDRLRTRMVSWKKKGSLRVAAPAPRPEPEPEPDQGAEPAQEPGPEWQGPRLPSP